MSRLSEDNEVGGGAVLSGLSNWREGLVQTVLPESPPVRYLYAALLNGIPWIIGLELESQ